MSDLVTLTAPMTDGLLCWFAETTLVGSALAVLAALCARIRGVAPGPAARHALWFIVLLKMVTPPLVHWPWSVPSPVATVRSGAEVPRTIVERAAINLEPESSFDQGPDPVPIELSETAVVAPTMSLVVLDDGQAGKLDRATGSDRAPDSRGLGTWIVLAWLVGSVTIGVGQTLRVIRFRRLLSEAAPAPQWLEEEAERVGQRLGVRVPTILIVPRLGTPLLWCLGRPVLLVPGGPLKTLEAGCWRAIVAHELAHLRRGDHWVRRLELLAGLVWWWNPLYWWVRHRLDFEAELACDAWAVWASPKDRLSYAESLLQICTSLSSAGMPAPALGVAGTGRSFERRLTMILRERVDCRLSVASLLGAWLLAALALPSWTMAAPTEVEESQDGAATVKVDPVVIVDHQPALKIEVITDEDDDDDDDDDEDKPAADKEKAAKDKQKAERAKILEKKKALAKEMEEKFGPGSEFAKKMEAMGKDMEAKFGPGSEFVKKMEAFGKEMEEKFGPGSEFAKELEAKLGEDLEISIQKKPLAKEAAEDAAKAKIAKLRVEVKAMAKANAEKAKADAQKLRAEAQKARTDARKAEEKVRAEAREKVKTEPGNRTRRIEALESRINDLLKELKQLKDEKDSEDDAGEN